METRSILSLPRFFKRCLRARTHVPIKSSRRFSLSSQTLFNEPTSRADSSSALGALAQSLNQSTTRSYQGDREYTPKDPSGYARETENARSREHHLHVYAHKHNCHITLTSPTYFADEDSKPRRRTILTFSSGNIGFRKSARGTYDAAFQLGSYMMNRINSEKTLKIERLEVVFRGHGPGREAVQKILLGVEGNRIRDKIIRVVDATRLKHGGTRSKKPRRLG